jgi:hypothetical protein
MNPIFERDHARGIGYEFDQLVFRFLQICRRHQEDHRAQSFAFIFYDLHDKPFQRMLQDPDRFAILDRLSGNNLTIFFLDYGSRNIINQFNETFAKLFEVPEHTHIPYILFFTMKDDDAKDVTINELWNLHPAVLFNDLYLLIQEHIATLQPQQPTHKKAPKFPVAGVLKIAGKITVENMIKFFVDKGMDKLTSRF